MTPAPAMRNPMPIVAALGRAILSRSTSDASTPKSSTSAGFSSLDGQSIHDAHQVIAVEAHASPQATKEATPRGPAPAGTTPSPADHAGPDTHIRLVGRGTQRLASAKPPPPE